MVRNCDDIRNLQTRTKWRSVANRAIKYRLARVEDDLRPLQRAVSYMHSAFVHDELSQYDCIAPETVKRAIQALEGLLTNLSPR